MRPSLSVLVREGNRRHCRYFKQEGIEFTELPAQRIAGRSEAVGSRLGFLVDAELVMFLHSETQATDGNFTVWNVSSLSCQEERNKDITSTIS